MNAANSSLSGDEVAALMDELSDISFAAAPTTADGVTPIALGQEAQRPTATFVQLERMNERVTRRMRDVIEPIARARARIDGAELETRQFDEWRRNVPSYTSLNLFRMRPVNGNMLIAIEPSFISNMVDTFYGGTGESAVQKTTEFTQSEDRLRRRIVGDIIETLTRTWAEFEPIEFKEIGHETNADYANMVRGDEAIVVQRFTIKAGVSRSTNIEILYPLSALRPIEERLAARGLDDPADRDLGWKQRLAAALDNVSLPVRSVLARPEMTVAQLLALKPGDVIPINLSSTVPLLVGNKRLAEGTIGEQDGRAALMIEKIGMNAVKGLLS